MLLLEILLSSCRTYQFVHIYVLFTQGISHVVLLSSRIGLKLDVLNILLIMILFINRVYIIKNFVSVCDVSLC